MVETRIAIPANEVSVPERVLRACADEGLRVRPMGALKQYPGSTHWHVSRANERGTLEITWWPAENRLWFKVAAGRTAMWINHASPKLRARLEAALRQSAEAPHNAVRHRMVVEREDYGASHVETNS